VTKMTPAEVNESNERLAWMNRYHLKEKPGGVKFKFNLGDTVRIALPSSVFGKGYHYQYSETVYRIVKRRETAPPVYELEPVEVGGSLPLNEGYYEDEMQRVDLSGGKKVKLRPVPKRKRVI